MTRERKNELRRSAARTLEIAVSKSEKEKLRNLWTGATPPTPTPIPTHTHTIIPSKVPSKYPSVPPVIDFKTTAKPKVYKDALQIAVDNEVEKLIRNE